MKIALEECTLIRNKIKSYLKLLKEIIKNLKTNHKSNHIWNKHVIYTTSDFFLFWEHLTAEYFRPRIFNKDSVVIEARRNRKKDNKA